MTAAEVQRYARQILIRDVGRAGQETWLASRVRARGSGPALAAAVELLRAAGVQVEQEDGGAPAEIEGRVLGASAFADRRAACPACLERFLASQPQDPGDEQAAVAFGLGSLVASDVLLGLLDPARPPQAMALAPRPRAADPVRAGCTCRS